MFTIQKQTRWSYYNYKSQRPKFCVGFEVAPFEKVKRLNKTHLDKKLSKKLTFHEVLECSMGFTRRSSLKKQGFINSCVCFFSVYTRPLQCTLINSNPYTLNYLLKSNM